MRKGPLIDSVSLLCYFKPTKQRLIDVTVAQAFRYRFILNPFCSNALIIFVLFFQTVGLVEFTRPNSWHTSAFFFTFPIYLITFPFKAKNLPYIRDCIHVLPRKQSPGNCRSRGKLYAQSELLLVVSLSRPAMYMATRDHRKPVLSTWWR